MVGQRDSDQNHRPMLLLLLQLFVFAVVNVLVILFVVFISIFDCWIKLGKFFMFVAKRGGKVKKNRVGKEEKKRENILSRRQHVTRGSDLFGILFTSERNASLRVAALRCAKPRPRYTVKALRSIRPHT